MAAALWSGRRLRSAAVGLPPLVLGEIALPNERGVTHIDLLPRRCASATRAARVSLPQRGWPSSPFGLLAPRYARRSNYHLAWKGTPRELGPFWLAREVSLDCYVFVSATATAFTTDPAGFNLPNHRGPWHYIRKAEERELRRREKQEVMQGLQTDGLAVINM
jgi:hypothetical protein